MKKNVFFLIFTLSFIGISNVLAEEIIDPLCKYKKISDETQEIVVAIDLEADGPYQTLEIPEVTTLKTGDINDVNLYTYGMIWPFIDEAYDRAVDYWKGTEDKNYADANKSCPPYFYVVNGDSLTGGNYVGIFSDKSPDQMSNPTHSYKFEGVPVDGDGTKKEERFSCTLYTEHISNYSLSMEINYTTKDIVFSGINDFNREIIEEYIKNFDYSKKNQIPDDLKVCYNVSEMSFQGYTNTTYTFVPRDNTKFTDSDSDTVCYDLNSSEKKEVGENYCHLFINLQQLYKNNYNNKNFSVAAARLNELKKYCSNILAHSNYDSYEYSCVNLCLNINDYIFLEDIPDDKCGISEKLAIYISNVVKWVKYIIPVLAIVLGILDFMKAIAADKDDEMKKAQGRFIKRLIAAALIFIIPFIIEFVLDIMGFERYIEGCGIIDL